VTPTFDRLNELDLAPAVRVGGEGTPFVQPQLLDWVHPGEQALTEVDVGQHQPLGVGVP
jgi:hypothetical protein